MPEPLSEPASGVGPARSTDNAVEGNETRRGKGPARKDPERARGRTASGRGGTRTLRHAHSGAVRAGLVDRRRHARHDLGTAPADEPINGADLVTILADEPDPGGVARYQIEAELLQRHLERRSRIAALVGGQHLRPNFGGGDPDAGEAGAGGTGEA